MVGDQNMKNHSPTHKGLLLAILFLQSTLAFALNNPWECAAIKRVANLNSGQSAKVVEIPLTANNRGEFVGSADGLTFKAITMPESIMTEAGSVVSIFVNPLDTTSSSGLDFSQILKTQLDPQNQEARNYILACINREVHPDDSTRIGAQFQRMLESID